MVSSKVDGRVSKRPLVHDFGRMVPTNEETPASTGIDPGRDQLAEGVDVTHTTESRRAIALDYVRRATADMQTAAGQRIHYMELARKYGCTFPEIAREAGVTDAAVRLALKRHGDA